MVQESGVGRTSFLGQGVPIPWQEVCQVACKAMGEERETRHEGPGREVMAPQGLPQPGSPDSLTDEDSPLQIRGEKNTHAGVHLQFPTVVQTGVRKAWDLSTTLSNRTAVAKASLDVD